MIGGTNSCANADGRAVTTDKKGAFSKKLPVTEPPKPCPCVVHVATVTGEPELFDAEFTVAGHPTADLPRQTGGGKPAVLASPRLEGESSLLTWFGAPPARRLVLTVGNLGSAPVKDPVFEIGTAHGVYAPQWEETPWWGTIAPGGKAEIKLPVELSAGARRLPGLPAVRTEGAGRAAVGCRPALGRHPLLDSALPGRSGGRLPYRHGGRGQGPAPAQRPAPYADSCRADADADMDEAAQAQRRERPPEHGPGPRQDRGRRHGRNQDR